MGLSALVVRAVMALAAVAALRRVHPALGVAGAPVVAALWTAAGVYFPDLDLLLPLDHRSILTHSILPALVLARLGGRPAAGGLGVGTGIHLSADLFPEEWTGFALVQVPLAGSLDAFSPWWILGNAVLATVLGVAWLRTALPGAAMGRAFHLGIAALAGWYLLVEEGSLLAPVVFAGCFALAVRLSAPRGATGRTA
ncbi:hypothetical protein [Arenibaculum pallidiluteum]|uniref:hypothetical protein n=1 Tax=Arenibaculum pallidiluteum TaxID=2812559 RepID=UPI001A964FF3|nr:hypothetical protein [Arenibaculum pallidiluteum]